MKFKSSLAKFILISMVLTSSYQISNPVFAEAIADSWAKPSVTAMEKANLIPGALKDDADLTKNVSREEFAELITTYYNAVEKQTSIPSPSESKFTDTKNPLIVMANKLGIVGGYPDGSFKPYNNITRQEIAVMANQAEKQLTNIGQTKNVDKFSDKAKIADWAKESVGSLSNAGGIGGYPDGTFKPTNNMTKQEAIALVSNLAAKAGLIEKPTAPTPPVAPIGGSVTDIPSTPTGVLNEAQEKLVVDGILAIPNMTRALWDKQVAVYEEAARGHMANRFVEKAVPPSGTKWLVNKDTVHEVGIPGIAGLEVKTDNGTLYYRVFQVGTSYENGGVRLTTEVNYRTEWQRLE
ncbi:S-layer homology domain-containing protein [Acetoanaerobium noterae]|uniref:S-layer homology domain-containing protein n=3 Tax=Acetoanaerobium noterae TaxID=745369 RepID=A0A1T5DAI2_9FIRM|nr:S-layer homology domain-containing protein [Acetoanaerobium noterae]SKB68597.1 S-layer homology domain-containing protein [Acetoanaerobium noterae]